MLPSHSAQEGAVMAKIRKYTRDVGHVGEAVQWEFEAGPGDKIEIVLPDGTTVNVESPMTIHSDVSKGKNSTPDRWQIPIKMITDSLSASKGIRTFMDIPRAIERLQVLVNDVVLIRLIEFSFQFNFSMDSETKLIAKGGLTEEGYTFFESQGQDS